MESPLRAWTAAAALVQRQSRSWGLWLGLGLVMALSPLWSWGQSSLGPWVGADPAWQPLVVGPLVGSYMGSKWCFSGSFVALRLGRGERVLNRVLVVGVCVGAFAAAARLGSWASLPSQPGAGPSALVGWLWTTALWTALIACLLSFTTGAGRCFLAAVTLAWWIPAVLPPSFLAAVPRALRQLAVGGPEIAAPQEPSAWLADTALVAGLLLLAWAPRRATPRSHEVRHPR